MMQAHTHTHAHTYCSGISVRVSVRPTFPRRSTYIHFVINTRQSEKRLSVLIWRGFVERSTYRESTQPATNH